MKSVIILYDLISREYWTCHQIKGLLEYKGYKVFLYQWNFEFYKALKAASNYNVELLIIPSCYTEADYKRVVMPFRTRKPDIKTICMHNEQIGYIGEENSLVPTEFLCKNTMYHFSWGEYFTDLLLSYGVKSELIIQTGNLRLQEAILKDDLSITREKLAEEFGLDASKKWILYCDSGGQLFYDMVNSGKLPSEVIGGSPMGDNMVEVYADTYIETLKILQQLDSKIYEDYEIIFRLHPGVVDVDNSLISDKIKVVRRYTIYTWLKQTEFNVTAISTGIFEGDAMGIKSFLLTPFPFKYVSPGVHEYTAATNSIEFENIVNNGGQNLKSGIYSKYIGSIDKIAFDMFIDRVDGIIQYENNELCSPICDVNNKKFFSSLVANFAFNLFNKLGILKQIKWPLTFDMNKYEHPYFKNFYL